MNTDKGPESGGMDWQQLRRDLVAAVRNGMEETLRRFYDEHFPGVYRYVLCRTGGDHTQTEEIVGDVFYQAFRDIERYDGAHHPHAWLTGIARHRTIDALRRRSKLSARTPSFTSLLEERGESFFDIGASELPEQDLERRETAELVEWVLSELPSDYERVLRLHYLDERPVRDIAQEMSTTVKAVESKLFRARKEFRDAFRRAARGLAPENSEVVQ